MAAPKYYGKAFVYFDGELMSENTTVSYSTENDTQAVKTNVLGFAGATPGPIMNILDISQMVPAADPWFKKLDGAEKNTEIHEVAFQQVGSGDKITFRAFVRNVKVSDSVGQNQELSAQFYGEPTTVV